MCESSWCEPLVGGEGAGEAVDAEAREAVDTGAGVAEVIGVDAPEVGVAGCVTIVVVVAARTLRDADAR